MATMKTLSGLFDDHEEIIIRLAEMAGTLRGVKVEGAAMPLLCLLDCSSQHWITWGPSERCANCGTPVLTAETWHRLLVGALRQAMALPAPQRRIAA